MRIERFSGEALADPGSLAVVMRPGNVAVERYFGADYLVQEGSDYAVDESGEKLRKRIKKQYERVMEAWDEIW